MSCVDVLSFWRSTCIKGRKPMRTGPPAPGTIPIRLIARLTQLKKASTSLLAFLVMMAMMSHNASTSDMMLPMTGSAPATVLMRSRLT
ncbi:hypothetical protein D3C71_1405110 [compost metagenome]